MAWATPQFSKQKVNWAGEALVAPSPANDEIEKNGIFEVNSDYIAWQDNYFEALDVVNNWRSSHNFPLNTFHIGLKRRAKNIDPRCVTAQRIKRLVSIEAKLERFPTMILSQMQDIGGCRAIVGSCKQVVELGKNYADSDVKHTLAQKDDYIACPKDSGYRGIHLILQVFF